MCSTGKTVQSQVQNDGWCFSETIIMKDKKKVCWNILFDLFIVNNSFVILDI